MGRQRDEQKQRTRDRILAAARKLFASPGYEETTIRMLASEASVASGSVFTTFESKEDVLLAITTERLVELAEHLTGHLDGAQGTARERLKAVFAAAYAFEMSRIALIMKEIGASWTWSRDMELRNRAQFVRPFRFIVQLVREARANGEIGAGADVFLLSDLLLSIYMRGYRHAWFRDLDIQATAALTGRQIDLLFDGARSAGAP